MVRRLSFALAVSLLAACNAAKQEAGPTPQPLQNSTIAPPQQMTGMVHYSFIDRFDDGSINSQADAATPTHRGALILAWRFGSGQMKSLTVLNGFRYSYPSVPVASGDVLSFEAAKPLEVGGPVNAFVDIIHSGKTTRVFQGTLPAAISATPVWKNVSVPLKPYAGGRVVVIFGTDALGKGLGTGAWAAFGNPTIFGTDRHG